MRLLRFDVMRLFGYLIKRPYKTNGAKCANKIFFDKENHMHFSFLLKMLILIRFA